MKIVDRNTFLQMPAGTVFCKFPAQPANNISRDYGHDWQIQIKHESLENDFCVEDLVPMLQGAVDVEGYDAAMETMLNGESVKTLYDAVYRDGLFKRNQLFMVWEPADLVGMIERLQRALDEQERETGGCNAKRN